MQRNHVEGGLQWVVGLDHGVAQSVRPEVPRRRYFTGGGQPVALVVDDDMARPDASHHVNRPREEATDRRLEERIAKLLVIAGERVGSREAGEYRRDSVHGDSAPG